MFHLGTHCSRKAGSPSHRVDVPCPASWLRSHQSLRAAALGDRGDEGRKRLALAMKESWAAAKKAGKQRLA